MERINKEPYFHSFLEINKIVNNFLVKQKYNGSIPVPIESIIANLDIDIIPVLELNYRLGIEGFIIPAHNEIYVEKEILEHPSPNRYFSTLAHELGHYCLHLDFMRGFVSEEDYIIFLKSFKWIDLIESQAWDFARLLLAPSNIFPNKYIEIVKELKEANKVDLSQYEKKNKTAVAQILSNKIADYFSISRSLARLRIINYLDHGI